MSGKFPDIDTEYHVTGIHDWLRSQGNKRVSKPASAEMTPFLQSWAEEVAEEAVDIAGEEGLSTVKKEHVKQALASKKSRKTDQEWQY